MDESIMKIAPEEREQIINKMRSYIGVKNSFECNRLARILNTDYFDDGQCWAKLIALIESAPTKRKIKAVELADKLESKIGNDKSLTYRIEEVLNINHDSSFDDVTRDLCNVLRNLDAPEDGMRWPLDKDDVPIKPGDTVYVGEDKYEVAYIEYGVISVGVRLVDSSSLLLHNPRDLTHKKPRTLDDIISEIMYSLEDGACDDPEKEVNALVHEAYEMGKAAGNEEASEV